MSETTVNERRVVKWKPQLMEQPRDTVSVMNQNYLFYKNIKCGKTWSKYFTEFTHKIHRWLYRAAASNHNNIVKQKKIHVFFCAISQFIFCFFFCILLFFFTYFSLNIQQNMPIYKKNMQICKQNMQI